MGHVNSDPEYIADLRRGGTVPVFSVSTDQSEVGRIQGNQIGALVSEGNILYIEGPSRSTAAGLRTKGMISTKPASVALKTIKADWTERSAHQAAKSWLALGSSRQLQIKAVICQNDVMAIGARKAFVDLSEADREQVAEAAVYGGRRCHPDRPGMGAPRTAEGHHHHRARRRNRARNSCRR
jgi:ABC-type sugar transport system substrate-binding protein